VYPQNPVFAVNANGLSNDDTPSRDANSPSVSGGKNIFRNKTIRVAPKHDYTSDSDQTRPTSPVSQTTGTRPSKGRAKAIQNDETPARAPSKGPGRGNWRRNRIDANGDPIIVPRSTPKSTGNNEPLTTVFVPVNGGGEPTTNSKRSRPPTSHQIALENFRKQRVNHIIDRGLRKERERANKRRKRENPIVRAWKRIRSLPDGYDSEEEAHMTGAGRPGAAQMGVALGGFGQAPGESDDYGAEAAEIAYMIGRFRRRENYYLAIQWEDEWRSRHPDPPEPEIPDMSGDETEPEQEQRTPQHNPKRKVKVDDEMEIDERPAKKPVLAEDSSEDDDDDEE
jgi:Ino eighty subunit 1